MCEVSVILPTYNRANLLPRAIYSVIRQTFTNWELIIWDDGSTDKTPEIIPSYQDVRIKYFFGENNGAAYARNKAIEKAKGRYIAFLGSDDIWSKEKLTLQNKVMEEYPQIEFLFGDYQNINIPRHEYGTGFHQNAQALRLLQTTQLEPNLNLITEGLPQALAIGNFIATDSILLRADVLQRVGVFNEHLRNSEDFELWWRMGLAGVQFAYIDKILMTRQKPEDSLSSPGVESGINTLKALDIIRKNSQERGCANHLLYLNTSYRNTWQNLITAYGKQNNLPMVFKAFTKSLHYGFRPGSVRLLVKTMINMAKK